MNAEHLTRLSAPWPGVSRDVKWDDDLIFSVGGRMFCGLCLRGREQGKLSFKVEPERFLEFTDRPGFRPAPYMARCHWVTLDDPSVVAARELDALLRRAYELVRAGLTRKLQREYEALESGAAPAAAPQRAAPRKTPAAARGAGKAARASAAPAAPARKAANSASPKRAVKPPAATVARKSAAAGKAAKRVRS